ncbi:aldose 1-epimerase [Mixta tenebrionis]|uniref:Aldose 1-epimerase n=1 Tax=Mixta tenebrionis TaxID=2562439 RepID=A0A506UXR0_9GAMM|nr:aldose 1-epimerase [Mixta tenebrionis]TPW38022.1 aldose 1-epimerase [Mixta tenebrionis]
MDALTFNNGVLRLTVAPQGASVLHLESLKHNRPVLYSAQQALFPMLPLANRVAGNAFLLHGEKIALPPSPVDERFFLHGDGWLQRWTLEQQSEEAVTLSCASRYDCGFDYVARLHYRLVDNALHAELTLAHHGQKMMVYGLGFHPFFQLQPDSRVQFSASGYWPEGEHHLPLAWQDTLPPAVDFSAPVKPADAWLNVGYSGWSGCALIEDAKMQVKLTSEAPWLMVFRQPGKPFICLEPQTHPVNAHNMAGMPGLRALQQGEATTLKMVIQIN